MKSPIKSFYDWYRNTIRHPQYRWIVIFGTLAYLISPIDISPDIFPIVGQLDDLMLVTLLVSELSQMAIDYFQSRQAKTNVKSQAKTNDNQGKTVDVDAVSVN